MSPIDKAEIKSSFEDLKTRDVYPANQPWILRNLTTKEFVRADGIALAPQLINGPDIRGIGFAELLILKTLWTNTANVLGCNPRGVWAGHRFDITTVDRHQKEMARSASQWADISEEVFKEMMHCGKENMVTVARNGKSEYIARLDGTAITEPV